MLRKDHHENNHSVLSPAPCECSEELRDGFQERFEFLLVTFLGIAKLLSLALL